MADTKYSEFPSEWGPPPRKSNNRRFLIFIGCIVGPLILYGLASSGDTSTPTTASGNNYDANGVIKPEVAKGLRAEAERNANGRAASKAESGIMAVGCPTIDALEGVYSASANGATPWPLYRVMKSYDCQFVYASAYTVIKKHPVVTLVLSGSKRLYVPTKDIR